MNLSVIIPARNEIFLGYTVRSVLENSDDGTEVIVILDGAWPEEGLPQHPRLKVIYFPKSIGQRGGINMGARVSRAKYIMKLDAHCLVDKGFDKVLIASAQELGREVTQVPRQYNLHAFDWVCPEGHRRYQGPSGLCIICLKCTLEIKSRRNGECQCQEPQACGQPTTRDIIMKIRPNRLTTRWRFDKELRFQYWGTRDKGPYIETMSLLGACWFLDRLWYWELGGSDEAHGSWGQQGTEIACKTWLSGGRLITNMNTWFSHMFRTQGGDFGFPYEIKGSDQRKAQQYSRDLWLNDKWPKAKHKLDWLIKKFNPPEWQ